MLSSNSHPKEADREREGSGGGGLASSAPCIDSYWNSPSKIERPILPAHMACGAFSVLAFA